MLRIMIWAVPVSLACLAAPISAQTASAAQDLPDTTATYARLHLTWRAPYGMPRATDTLSFACGNTTRLDTLFMSFEPTSASTSFTGFTAALWIKPLAGDSLSSIWDGIGLTDLPLWMKIDLSPDSATGCPTPLRVYGAGGAACHHTPDGDRIIRMVRAVAYADSVPLEAGKSYGLAQFLIRQPERSAGCSQPVCIQWLEANIGSLAGRFRTIRPQGVGVVLNPVPGGATCFGTEAHGEASGARSSAPHAAPQPKNKKKSG